MCSYVNWTENESILLMRFPFSVSSLRDQKYTKYHQKHIKVVFLPPPLPTLPDLVSLFGIKNFVDKCVQA